MLLAKLNISNRHLAKRMKVSETTISLWKNESNKIAPTPRHMIRLVRILGCKKRELQIDR
jgi:plasmid maintenance system antidote protein VapI